MPTLPHNYVPHLALGPLGALLRKAREAARLSLKEFALSLDYSPSYLSDVERGQRGVSRQMCDQLSARLGLDRIELYARSGHLSDAVLAYLYRVPQALGVLELLAEMAAPEEVVVELCRKIRQKEADSKQQTAPDPEGPAKISGTLVGPLESSHG